MADLNPIHGAVNGMGDDGRDESAAQLESAVQAGGEPLEVTQRH